MKKLTKAQDGIISKKEEREMARATRKSAREGRKIKTQQLVDQGTFTPREGRQLRRAAAKQFRQEQKEKKETSGIMKTGGMVNANSKVSASKVVKGRVGGTSSAPKTAVPKAKYGMPVKPGMIKKGSVSKMQMGVAKPKAKYGMSTRSSMMKKGGIKKK